MLPNHHITKPVLIGEIQADGQFDIVWKTPGLVLGDAWSKYLDGSKDLIADWVKPEVRQLQHQDRASAAATSTAAPALARDDRGRRRFTCRLPSIVTGEPDRMRGCYARVCVAIVLSCARPRVRPAARCARRRPTRRPLAKFATDTFNDTDAGIAGARRAAAIRMAANVIEALQDGRLLVQRLTTRRVYVKREASGTLLDAATGKPSLATAPPADLKPVRLNNRLRRTIEAALGALTLLSPDPAKRLRGGRGGVQVARTPTALPALDAAIARRPMRASRAHCRRRAPPSCCSRPTPARPTRSRPSASSATRGDQDARGLLAGVPANQTPAVQRAAADGHRRHRQQPAPSGTWRRMSGTACRSARCCCSPPSASPSPSASWASSTWRMARW